MNNLINANVSRVNIKGGNEMKNQKNEQLTLFDIEETVIEVTEAPVVEEGGKEMNKAKQYLVVKNKVEYDKIFWIEANGQLSSENSPKAVPCFVMDKTIWQVQMAGVQDLYDAKILTEQQVAEILPFVVDNVESSYALTLLKKETPIIDGRNGLIVDLKGRSTEMMYGVPSNAVGKDKVDLSNAYLFKPGFAGPGQKRKGVHGMLLNESSYFELVENKWGVSMSSFGKRNGDYIKFPLKKVGTRVNLASSSATIYPLFNGYKFSKKEHKTYSFLESEITSTVYVLVNENGDEIRMEHIPEDFSVTMTEELYTSKFNEENAEFGKELVALTKAATDGMAIFSKELMSIVDIKASFTFRMMSVAKGLGVLYPNLKEVAGSDIILFGGAVKAPLDEYVLRNQFDFGVLLNARTKDSKLVKLSRQAAKRLLSKELFRKYHDLTRDIIKGVMSLDIESVKEFLSIGKELSEEEIEEVSSEDIQTLDLYNANPEVFLKDASLRNTLRALLMKQIERLINGEYIIINDAVWRHMATDPYTIIKFVSVGRMSCSSEEANIVGIHKGHTATYINGKINMSKALLVRFPFIHKFEGRLVNVEGKAMSAEAYKFYTENADIYVGLNIYSAADQTAEAQSGADFDGDATLVIQSPDILEEMEVFPIFLDYSMVENKVVSGAPYEDVKPVSWDFMSNKDKELVTSKGIILDVDGSVKVPVNFAKEVEVVELLWKATANLSMQSLAPGFVGLLSYASDTVVEFMTTISDEKRIAQLDRLNSFLTAAVRWEIDKTKHGGAFYEALPFLGAIVEGTTLEELKEMEAKYDLWLTPFFKERNELYRFSVSATLYFGRKVPKSALYINSSERKSLMLNTSLIKQELELRKMESSNDFHLVSIAKEIIKEGIANGAITRQIFNSFDWDNADKFGIKHPIKFLKVLGNHLSPLYSKKAFATEEGDINTYNAVDKVIKTIRRKALKFSSEIEYNIDGKYIFAMTYLSIAKNQSKLCAKKKQFRMSYVPNLFYYFGKQAMEFLLATKELQAKKQSCGHIRFVVSGEVAPAPYLVFVNGTLFRHENQVILEDALTKDVSGIISVSTMKKDEKGTLIIGTFVSSIEEAKQMSLIKQ